MPFSDISRLSVSGVPRSELAIRHAQDVARQEISSMIATRQLNPHDRDTIQREYRSVYTREYYRYYALSLQSEQRVIYVPTDNLAAKKFYGRHSVVRFSKLNYFIHVHKNCITVGRVKYPIDDDISLDTKEAHLSSWPGPLDRSDESLKPSVTNYIETLRQHDSQRRIRYVTDSTEFNDEQRKMILKLLTELLHRNGSIDAPGITRLLLKREQTEIQKDESNTRPLETLQKYLLLGKRTEAIKFARTKKLWDHAQCLAFLDRYQPPTTNHFTPDSLSLKDDSIVQLNTEYIGSVDHGNLKTIYLALLNRILQSDPESMNIVKDHFVGNNHYEFALLSANDCKIEFDQSNEIFKLIVAIKQANSKLAPRCKHLISLGFPTIDLHDVSDDYNLSHLSFKQGDTYFSRTSTISNIEIMILNEIWEYCLNLSRGTCNPNSYEYVIDLVPYKLIIASKLLDFGMHPMFALYLSSIKNALARAKSVPYTERDSFYDWITIEKCVEYLSDVWDVFCNSPEKYPPVQEPSRFNAQPQFAYHATPTDPGIEMIPQPQQPPPQPSSSRGTTLSQNIPPPQSSVQPLPQNIPPSQPYHYQPPPQMVTADTFSPDYPDTARDDYALSPYQNDTSNMTAGSTFEPPYSPINENDDFKRRDSLSSRRTSAAYPHQRIEPQLEFNNEPPQNDYPSLPYQGDSVSTVGESFDFPLSPINQPDSSPRRQPEVDISRTASGNPSQPENVSSNENEQREGENRNQQPGSVGFLTNFIGSAKALLPKSNSKPMILPDDSQKSIVYDNEKRGWVDLNQPAGSESNNLNDAPPMMAAPNPPSYSYVTKSSKSRYPKAQF